MIRAVIDTNILVRAFIKPQGTVGPVLQRLRDGDYVLVSSSILLDELIATLLLPRIRIKYHVDEQARSVLLALLALRSELVEPEREVHVCRDPDDDRVIEAALAGNAAYVVTGDNDLLVLERFEDVVFLTPRDFLALF